MIIVVAGGEVWRGRSEAAQLPSEVVCLCWWQKLGMEGYGFMER